MRKYHWFSRLVILLLPLMIVGVNALMTRFDFGDSISQLTIDAAVHEDGSLSVVQTIQYLFREEGNGFYIDFDHAFEDLAVEEERSGEFVPYQQSFSAVNGDTMQYTLEGHRVKIFCPTSSGTDHRTFRIRYTIPEAAERHADIGELYWYAVPKNVQFPIDSLIIQLTTPQDGADKNSNRIYGHSAAAGQMEIVDENHFRFVLSDLKENEPVEIRALFSASSLSAMPSDGTSQLELITAEEAQNIAAQNRVQRLTLLTWVLGGVALAAMAGLCIYLYLCYDREYPLQQEYDYYRDLPEDIPPAQVAVLYHYKKLGANDITATIMDLARRGYLTVENAEEYVARYGLERKVRSDSFVLCATEKARDALSTHERFLLEWLMDQVGQDRVLFLDDLDTVVQTSAGAERFLEDYKHWKNLVLASTGQYDYFDDKLRGGRVVCLVIGIAFLVIWVLLSILTSSQLNGRLNGNFLWLAAALPLVVYPLVIRRRSRYGNQKYHEWKAFRRFLLDFSNLKEAPQESLAIWEHYLVYAVTLGVAEQVIRQLKIILPPEVLQSQPALGLPHPGMFYLFSHNMMVSQAVSRSVSSSITSALSSSRSTISASSSGSSGGLGGGFTGGGGGGFGGGGGSGRF